MFYNARMFFRRRKPTTQLRKTYRKRTSSVYRRRRYIRRGMSPEVKTIEVRNAPAINSGGFVQLLNGLTRTTTAYGRIGNKVFNKALCVKGFCAVTPATGVDQIHMLMIVKDLKPTGALPTLANILQNVAVYDFPNTDYNTRFKTLWRREFAMNATAEAGSIKPFKFFKKLLTPTQYLDSTNGDITDIEQNAYYLVGLGTSVAGATAGAVNYASKLYFQDS